ncbi:MAG TPA: hypothetical protein VMO26_06680 [Vicinamibacterales bacterium]|nr:hypothetical protein [Vicinamibacterales bacterium]
MSAPRLRWTAAFVASVSVTMAASVNSVSTVIVGDDAIVINVPIEVLGADEALVARWKHSIEQVWNLGNNGKPFSVCGRAVVFNPQFTLRRTGETLTSDAHIVIVEVVKPGQRYISRVWHALGTSPTYSARTGFWGSDTDGATAAHEFGHLLGLLDEYVESETGMRAPGERPFPDEARFPDAWLSLMAHEHGSVLGRHVREIIRIHGAQDALACAR